MLIYADSFAYDTVALFKKRGFTCVEVDQDQIQFGSGGRAGGRYLSVKGHYGHAGWARYAFNGSNATIAVQFGYASVCRSEGPLDIVVFEDGTTQQCRIIDDGYGIIKAYRGSTLLGTATNPPLVLTTWNQLEIKVGINSSTGSILVKLNGQTVLNLTDQNTQSTGNALCTAISHHSVGQECNQMYFSDYIIMDTSGSYCNDLLGPRLVELKVPTADGYHTQFTPSSGSNYSCVDEVPPNETDYNTGDVDEQDSFMKANLVNGGASVDAVVCSMYCRVNDGGAANLKALVRSNSVDGLGTEVAVPASWGYVRSVVYVDPNTGSPFIGSNFNSAEVGYKRTA